VTALVLRGDARHLPLPDASVDLIVTSPPYFGLRSYTDGGEHYGGQIGSEATPQEWVAALVECTAEFVRVLKPSGSIFVNLGDKYSGNHGTDRSRYDDKTITGAAWRTKLAAPDVQDGGRPKSLLGLPWRYALACTDQLGLILRAEIIWAKPNGLPESVTDRVRRAHEQIFHFTRQPRYYAAVDEIREPHAPASMARYGNGFGQTTYSAETGKSYKAETVAPNPLGKLPGSVWDIPSQPLTVPAHLGVDHFAAFPMELPRRIIAGWSPAGVCVACGEGRRPVAERGPDVPRRPSRHKPYTGPIISPHGAAGRLDIEPDYRITGYACACTPYTGHPERRRGDNNPQSRDGISTLGGGEREWRERLASYPGPVREYHFDRWIPPPTRPAVVVDPFGGTGTTSLVASMLGRTGLSVDLSWDYSRLAAWRTQDPAERAKALQVPKPPPVIDGQEALWA
jgi:DNA modification methylase